LIPAFTAHGLLPEGVHPATLEEVLERFGGNERREQLLTGLIEALRLLRAAGCRRVYVNGSFVTSKERPNDIDACWDIDGVDADALDPVFFDFDDGRAAQKARFGAEFFPARLPEGLTGRAFMDFFQVDRQTGEPKGIIELRLDDG
jgi:predicted nucleotidyltransferase